MAKDFAVITIHGMGDTKIDYYKSFEKKLRNRVGKDAWDAKVHLEHVYYQDLLQGEQEDYYEDSDDEHDLRWDILRKLMIFGFNDAAAIEHSLRKDEKLYIDVHKTIAAAFDNAYRELGNQAKPVFVVAQSLGAQQVSNYLWDAQNKKRLFLTPGAGSPEQQAFRQFSHCKQFITTGCNIPLFKAGLPKPENFKQPNPEFTWHNYFDADDVLGYPVRKIAPSFADDWIEDRKVSVGRLFTGWNPASHTRYWTDKDVLNPIAKDIKAILGL